MKIKSGSLDYTGGGIWCITGELETGEIFISDSDYFTIGIFSPGILTALAEENENLKGSPFQLTIYDLDAHIMEEYFLDDLTVSRSCQIWKDILTEKLADKDPNAKTIMQWLEKWYKSEL